MAASGGDGAWAGMGVGWAVTSTLVGGIVVWGSLGYVADRLLGLDLARLVPALDTTRATSELGWQPRHVAKAVLDEVVDGIASASSGDTAVLRSRRIPREVARLLDAPGAVLVPHIGSATGQARTAMAELAARNAAEALSGRRPPNAV